LQTADKNDDLAQGLSQEKICVRSFINSRLLFGLVLPSLSFQSSVARAQSGSLADAAQLNQLKLIAAPVGGENLTSRPKYQLNERPVIRISLRNKSVQDVPVQHDDHFFQYQLNRTTQDWNTALLDQRAPKARKSCVWHEPLNLRVFQCLVV
jgi:hypothetical protein